MQVKDFGECMRALVCACLRTYACWGSTSDASSGGGEQASSPPESPQRLQLAPKRVQVGPKWGDLRGAQEPPSWPKEVHKSLQEPPKTLQETPKRLQVGLQRGPREVQELQNSSPRAVRQQRRPPYKKCGFPYGTLRFLRVRRAPEVERERPSGVQVGLGGQFG